MRLLISTGEISGDLQGSLLIKALKKEALIKGIDLEIYALGGPRMKAAGADIIADTTSIGSIGLFESLPFLFPTLKIQSTLDKFLSEYPIDCLVLIDYMGPNIRLGIKLRRLIPEIPIIYYIAPQEWAWRLGDSGTTDLIGFTDKILAIFKAEAEFYEERGAKVSWVGHPMLDTLEELPTRIEAFKALGIDPNRKLLLLFPASRSQEIRYLMPVLAQAANLIQKQDPSVYVLVPSGLSEFEPQIQKALHEAKVAGQVIPSEKVDDLKKVLFAAGDLAIGKSGTVNMELALNNIPQIVGYKVGKGTALLARKILNFRVEYISPVNLILKKEVLPELLQENFTPENIVKFAMPLLNDKQTRDLMLENYNQLHHELGSVGVTDRAAKQILESIEC